MTASLSRARSPIPKAIQIQVFAHDRSLCKSCRRQVVFAPVLRLLAELVKSNVTNGREPAYYHAHWTRANAPLLDELGACIDHVKAHSRAGSIHIENLATLFE